MIVSTSWDDGYALDLRIADLLDAHGATGTFYACPSRQHGQKMLSREELFALSKRHKLGAHTLSHPHLTKIPPEKVQEELVESKKWIENISDKQCSSFCYPYGDQNESVQQLVRAAGFTSARTVRQLEFSSGDNPFALPTSLHVYPFPFRPVFSRQCLQPFLQKKSRLKELNIPYRSYRSWLSLAKALFTQAYNTNQPWFHLWGHSAEIDTYKLWHSLERFLAFISTHKNIEYRVDVQ